MDAVALRVRSPVEPPLSDVQGIEHEPPDPGRRAGSGRARATPRNGTYSIRMDYYTSRLLQ